MADDPQTRKSNWNIGMPWRAFIWVPNGDVSDNYRSVLDMQLTQDWDLPPVIVPPTGFTDAEKGGGYLVLAQAGLIPGGF